MAEVAQGVVALIPSARGFSDLLHKEIGGGLVTAGEKGGEQYAKGMKGKVAGLAKGVFAPMIAAGSTVAIAGLLKDSVGEAREAEKVGAITSQIIKSTGGAAKVTADQVGDLSEKLSLKSGVDDEVIQSGANMLLTFKQVRNEVGKGNDIFDRATAAANDLSAAGFGDMAGQSKMLGKALNDPVKGMSALSRSGVTFTAEQQAKIKSLVAEGKQLEAQKIMLTEIESQVGGTAEAQATAGDKAAVAWGNLQETIGTGLLPVIDKMQTIFTEKIAPAISSFVQGMQDGTGAGGTFVTRLTQVKNILATVGGFLVEHKRVVLALLAAYAGYKVAAATLRAFNAVVLFGKGVQQGYALATYGATAATKANTLAEKIGLVVGKAKLVFTKAITIATKAWAVAQRLLNVALRMNPIGLVVTALLALGTGLVIAYKKSETFRRIVDAAWAGVKRAAQATVEWFVKTAWPSLKRVFSQIGAVATWLWRNAFAPAFRGIGAVISWWYTNIVKRYFAAVRTILRGVGSVAMWLWRNAFAPAFRGIGAVASWLWSKALKPVFGRIMTGAKVTFGWIKNTGGPWVRDAFQAIGDKAKWLWEKGVKPPLDRMKAGFRALTTAAVGMKDAIVKQFGKVRDGIQKPLREVMTFIDKKFISKVKGMLHGVGLGSLSVKIPYLTPGGKGYATGGYTGPGGKYQPAGIVHADEFVVKKSSRRKFERDNPGALDHINRFGTMPGYAIGGKVQGLNKKFLEQLSAFNAAAGNRYTVNSGYRSVAHQQQLYNQYLAGRGPVAARPGSSQHNFGLAADLAPSNARDVHGALAKQFGLVFTVPSESWHIEPTWGRKGGSKGGSFIGNALSGFSAKVFEGGKKVLTDILDKIPGADGFWGKVAIAPMRMVAGGVFEKFKEAASMMSAPDPSGGGSFDFSGVTGATNLALGRGMAAAVGWTGAQWSALKELWTRESNWNHLARNPSSGAYGIPQSLPASKMGSVMQGGGSDYLTNPKTQISWGLRYIKNRYGNPGAALAFHNRMNWYDGGGLVRPPVFDNGGTLAPGLNLVHNKLGKPEPLIRPEHALAGPVVVNVIDRDGTFIDRMRGEIDMARAHDDRLAVR